MGMGDSMKKGSGITLPSSKAKKTSTVTDSPASQIPMTKTEEVKRQVITYRINPDDKQLLTIYAATNGTKIQELLNQALRLLAVERDIPLSDEIMKG